MRRSILFAIIFAAGLLVSAAREARAQDDEPRWEVGGHFTALDFNNSDRLTGSPGSNFQSESYPTASGFGARVGYNVTRHVAVEAELNYFPRDRFLEGGRKVQGLFGVKAGKRFERVGVYAKARPGFLRLSRGDFHSRPNILCIAPFPGCFESEPTTSFALDLGGVVELYPSKHTFVRFDGGDTLVRFGQRLAPVRAANTTFIIATEGGTAHNFQGGVGFGFRF